MTTLRERDRLRAGQQLREMTGIPIALLAVDVGPLILSEPAICDLHLYRGDTGRFRVTVTDGNGAPYDVSAATWDCDVRVTEDTPAPMATLTVTPVAGDTSSVDVILTKAQSALITTSGVWDLEMTVGTEVVTLLAGKCIVTKDVSRTP